jgi:hypothetical protein
MSRTQEPQQHNQQQEQPESSAPSNTVKDPDQWKTGDQSMTGAQASYLRTLSDEAGEPFDERLTKAEASKRIDELQERTGRGIDH